MTLVEARAGRIRAAADELCARADFRAALMRHCRWGRVEERLRLDTRIHGDDPMLWHSLRSHPDVNWGVSQYFAVALQQHFAFQQVLRAAFGSGGGSRAILDFACGHGRMLRFLVLALPPSQVWASDIQKDAVDFVRARFGVHGIYSTPDPTAFHPGRRFNFIWVASLFSHLPETLFRGWLARLVELLADAGVLCFSAHSASSLPANVVMPGAGIYFHPLSENPALDERLYGSTYVSEAFVQKAVAAAGPRLSLLRIARGLANEQDLYVVTRGKRDQLAAGLARFRRGPWGCVDRIDVDPEQGLRVQGWAGSLDDGALGQVEIRLDGECARAATGVYREDVARVLEDGRLASSGFDFRAPLPAGAGESFLEVSARSPAGEAAMIYAGPIAMPTPGAAQRKPP